MIYIIIDQSHEYYDFEVYERIIYVSTNKKDAENTFAKYCENLKPDEKYRYSYTLYECEDGYNYYLSLDEMTVLKHSDNDDEQEEQI